MNLSFHNIPLRDICEDDDCAKKEYGDLVASVLQNRLSDLRAASKLGDLPPLKGCGITKVNSIECYKIPVGQNYLLIVHSNHIKNVPKTKIGSIDWANVTRLKIIEIIKDEQ